MVKQFIAVSGISLLVAFFLLLGVKIWVETEKSTHIVIGIAFSWLNILFYSFVALLILHKKNIAWAMTMIVIKYLILVLVLFYVWATADIHLVVVGVFAQLLITALAFIPLKKFVLG